MAQLPPDEKLTPAVIANAPDSVPVQDDGIPDIPENHPIWILIGNLQVEIGDLRADNDRLNAESDPVVVKARLLKPYANKIFSFLVGYTVAVFGIITLHGFGAWGFHLPDTVLTVLAGSSLVSVLGLIGTIISGLFASPK